MILRKLSSTERVILNLHISTTVTKFIKQKFIAIKIGVEKSTILFRQLKTLISVTAKEQQKKRWIKGDLSNTNDKFELIIIYQKPTVAEYLFFSSTQNTFIWLDVVSEVVTN